MVNLVDLSLLTAFIALLTIWWRAQRTRELALAATKRSLKEQQLKLLDDNVALRSMWFKRDRRGSLRFWRRYNFEFTVSGHERYQGYIVTLGNRVVTLHLPPHRVPEESSLH